jgi:DNA-binding CsgD family transcriptional regulator
MACRAPYAGILPPASLSYNPPKQRDGMSKSSNLRLQDIRQAYRLIGDCRDLGSTPELWQERLFEGVLALVGADRASGGEGAWVGPQKELAILSAHFSGFDPGSLDHLLAYTAYLRANGPIMDPFLTALRDLPGRLNTRARRHVVAARDWYRSTLFNEFFRPADCNHQLCSNFETSPSGTITHIGLHRRVRARDFSGREQRLLHFFHGELGPLVGRVLVSVTEPRPDDLSPRLRQTLHCLLEGDSEKQVAARLELSQSTIHEYVTALYRHFRVHSRPELMAHAMKRLRQPAWQRVQQQGTNPSQIDD